MKSIFHDPEKSSHIVILKNAAPRQNFSIRESDFRIVKNYLKSVDFAEKDFCLI